jgi:hypothetical protein
MWKEILQWLIFLSGIGHIGLSIASLMIPQMLQWKEELKSLKTLYRQMFWTYAGYILCINLCFGLISIGGSAELLNRSFLAQCVCLFIGLYWLARVFIQFFYFDTSDAPKGLIFTLGEIALVAMFIGFSIVYLGAYSYNCQWIS